MTAHHGDSLDGIGHGADRNSQRACGHLLRRRGPAGRACNALRQFAKSLRDDLFIQRFIGGRPEHARKKARLDPPEQDVGIGDGERAAASITGRTGAGAGRFRPHPQSRAVESNNGPAAGGNAVNAHHRRANPHAAHLGIECPFELAGEMTHIGGGSPHVEADQLLVPARLRRAHHADNAAGRTRKNGILAVKALRLRQPAGALHEKDRHARHQIRELVAIAAQNRRKVGIHHCRIAARHQLHQGTDTVRYRNLRESDIAGDARRGELVVYITVAVQKDNGARPNAIRERALQLRLERLRIQR